MSGGYVGQDDAFATESNPEGFRPDARSEAWRREREREMRSNELRDRYESQQRHRPTQSRERSHYEAAFGGFERAPDFRDAGRVTRASQSSFMPDTFDERSDMSYDQWVRGQQGDFRRSDQRGAGGQDWQDAYQTRTHYAGAGLERGSQARERKGPKGYTRSDDRLREDICERLTFAHHLDVSDVSVTVQDGKVTLEGTVPDRRSKHAIEDVVDESWGVREIDNRVRIARQGSFEESQSMSRVSEQVSEGLGASRSQAAASLASDAAGGPTSIGASSASTQGDASALPDRKK
ncbi:BON domain-containing protein [Uliginosibacterium sp. sgz301328]|uniref:BON domain-containing protein n=1 Tax=Uliginosibacterium sp. sgz301328 TaxID=3243764 RepID=UPI00359DD4EF